MRCRLSVALVLPLALLGGLALAQGAGAPRDDQARNAWLYKVSGKDGWFAEEAGKRWIESTSDGKQFQFEELRRTAKYVELYDGSRTMWLRLFADHVEWRQGTKPDWFRLYDGRWVRASDLPKAAATDYRIRLAYFVPTDRTPTADYAAKIRVVMGIVSELYRQDFTARKIASPGLRFQTRDGQPVVHLIRGRRNAAFYNNAPNYDTQNQWKTVLAEIPESVGAPGRNVIIVFAETYDDGPAKFEWPGGVALGVRFSTDGGVGLFSAWILRPEFCATTPERQKKMLFDTTPSRAGSHWGTAGPTRRASSSSRTASGLWPTSWDTPWGCRTTTAGTTCTSWATASGICGAISPRGPTRNSASAFPTTTPASCTRRGTLRPRRSWPTASPQPCRCISSAP
jgi:hypothetical protein